MGRLSDTLTLGASYSSKINMSKFDKYSGLFAGGGDFDIPANYSVGVAFMPTPDWTLALDYGRINYSGVAAVGNASTAAALLGSDNGPGFGWRDVNVLKLGAAWRMNERWTLRAGYNHGDNPIRSADVTFNILAPGVITDHYTAGFTWAANADSELTGALMIAPRKSVTGSSMFNGIMGPGAGGSETIGMRQMSLGLAWSLRF
ncbi:MAG: outer membrane protein transport protein [Rhizobacter sp.]|nr:outer membrane protein transport protein [Rhizobacter sp.]